MVVKERINQKVIYDLGPEVDKDARCRYMDRSFQEGKQHTSHGWTISSVLAKILINFGWSRVREGNRSRQSKRCNTS